MEATNDKKKLIIIAVAGARGRRRRLQDRPGQAEGEGARAQGPRHGLRPPEGVPGQPRRRPLRQAAGRARRRARTPVGRPAATAPPAPPEGYGAEPQEAIIRDLITDELTDASDHELIQREGREKIKKQILKSIKEHTDVHVEEVLFPDVTVQ